MAIIVNTKGVDLDENIYINKEGSFLLKIEKIEEDGYTSQGALKFKIHFKGRENGTKDPIYKHFEMFNLQQNSLWKIKQLELALKAPEIYNVEDFVGRYVVGNVVSKQYEKNGETKTAYGVKSWAYSKANDKLPPIPEAVQDTAYDNDVFQQNTDANIDIDDEEIPF